MSNLRDDLRDTIRLAGADWKKAKQREERVNSARLQRFRASPTGPTIRDAAFAVMEAAFNHASGDGQYLAEARTIMYSARPLVLERTGGDIWKNSSYFTQTLLKDYIEEISPSWKNKVVWDARGHLHEPHTGRVVGVGGAEVRKHLDDWTTERLYIEPVPTIDRFGALGTEGPALRYSAALWIEKESISETLRDAGIQERFDLAILSTKGIAVKAGCEVVRRLHEAGVPVYVARDFDLAGFKLVRTLRRGTRLATGTPVTDLGLRLQDVEEMGLESEEVQYNQKKDPRHYLRRCGATEEEAAFLVSDRHGWDRWRGQRVELNAMTVPRRIEWLEGKLEAAGVKKVVPKPEKLEEAYIRAIGLTKLREEAKRIAGELEGLKVPADLAERVAESLEEDPAASWEAAVAEIAISEMAEREGES